MAGLALIDRDGFEQVDAQGRVVDEECDGVEGCGCAEACANIRRYTRCPDVNETGPQGIWICDPAECPSGEDGKFGVLYAGKCYSPTGDVRPLKTIPAGEILVPRGGYDCTFGCPPCPGCVGGCVAPCYKAGPRLSCCCAPFGTVEIGWTLAYLFTAADGNTTGISGRGTTRLSVGPGGVSTVGGDQTVLVRSSALINGVPGFVESIEPMDIRSMPVPFCAERHGYFAPTGNFSAAAGTLFCLLGFMPHCAPTPFIPGACARQWLGVSNLTGGCTFNTRGCNDVTIIDVWGGQDGGTSVTCTVTWQARFIPADGGACAACGEEETGTASGRALAPVARDQWPEFAVLLAAKRAAGDRGVGDTARRIIGDVAHEMFKATFRVVFRRDCKCDVRRAEWNALYPYEDGEGGGGGGGGAGGAGTPSFGGMVSVATGAQSVGGP